LWKVLCVDKLGCNDEQSEGITELRGRTCGRKGIESEKNKEKHTSKGRRHKSSRTGKKRPGTEEKTLRNKNTGIKE